MPAKFVTKKTDITTVTEVEMDEMHHFLKKTQKLWFWKTIFHREKNSSDGHWDIVPTKR